MYEIAYDLTQETLTVSKLLGNTLRVVSPQKLIPEYFLLKGYQYLADTEWQQFSISSNTNLHGNSCICKIADSSNCCEEMPGC